MNGFFPKSAPILTKRGLEPISSVAVGDYVWTHNARWRQVTRTEANGGKVFRVTGYGNSAMLATSDQLFYGRERAARTSRGSKHFVYLLEPTWVSTSQLIPEMKSSSYLNYYSGIAWSSPRVFPVGYERIPKMFKNNRQAFLRIVGRWLGDGWIRQRKNRQDLVRICEDRVAKKKDKFENELSAITRKYQIEVRDSVLVYDLPADISRILVGWLLNNFNHGASNKTLPAWVFSLPDNEKIALIEGYAAADGHTRGSKVSTTSVSISLAVGIRMLLLSLGTQSGITVVSGKQRKIVGRISNVKTAYTVAWDWLCSSNKVKESDLHFWGKTRKVKRLKKDRQLVGITVEEDNSFIAYGQVVKGV